MEMLMVIGLVALIATLTLFMDINSYRGSAFRSEVGAIGTAMQTARADSFNNINEAKHGVAFLPSGVDGYVIFEGNSYALRDTSKDVLIKASYNVDFAPSAPSEIVFEQLSGDANYSGDITIIDPIRNMSANINTNSEGKIAW